MADVGPTSLTGFEASLRRATVMRWPHGDRLGIDDTIELVPGATDLLVLSHRPSSRFLRRDPVHASLMLELAGTLDGAAPGPVAFGRGVYRAGGERLMYQSTHATGELTLTDATADRFVLTGTVRFDAPDHDFDRVGPLSLSGTINLARR